MEPLIIKETQRTPFVSCDSTIGKIQIKGRSLPENPVEFYRPISEWIERYRANPFKCTLVDIHLEYFNTSSSKCLLDLFIKLREIHKINPNVVINWYYDKDDSEMLEAGTDYEAIVKVPFQMIKIES